MVEPTLHSSVELRSRYRIERELGRGSNAVVYLALDLKHDRLVALKVLSPELAGSILSERFLREIQIVGKLAHPHIVPLYDSGNAGGTLYHVMQYVAGESLRDRLRREQRLPVDAAVQISRDVADALGYAHGRGIIHRDIKPENILIQSGHAIVADFGIALALSAATGVTQAGGIIGTPTYMSPEQASGGSVDSRTDLYALGCVLYEMLAGRPPFEGATWQEILVHHALDSVPALRSTRAGVPEQIDGAVMRLLAKQPEDRFPNTAEFIAAIAEQKVPAAGSFVTAKEPGARDTPIELAHALSDRYVIERKIGSGGMATVYLAHDRKHDRQVALKVLRPELGAMLGAERFLSEVRISARLDHPHILTLIDSGENDGFLWYALPYVRGESLREKLDSEKQLPIETAIEIIRQIASALDYAHQHGVVHRDIKPGNILMHEGEAMLADFGLALAVKEAGGRRLTETGLSIGTPYYMSPEQATSDRALDARSDVYSLAAVLYEMLAGEPPVTGPTVQAMIAKLLTESPVRLRVVRSTVPEAIDAAVAKALAKLPADRFDTAGEFVRAFGTTPSALARARTRFTRIGVATACGLVAVAAVSVALLRGGSGASAVTTQLTSNGASTTPAISPDGNFVAYATENCAGEPRQCQQSLMVQDLASGSRPTQVAAHSGVYYSIKWSLDGKRIFFSVFTDSNMTYAVARFGGPLERIGSFFAVGLSPDGRRAIGANIHTGTDSLANLSILDPVTWAVTQTLSVPGHQVHDVQWSPDGRWIAVTAGLSGSAMWRLYLLDTKGQIRDQVEEPFTDRLVQVRWSSGSDAIYHLANGSISRSNLIRRSIHTRRGRFELAADTVVADLQIPTNGQFDVTADGKTLVYDGGQTTGEFWTLQRAAVSGPWQLRRLFTSTLPLISGGISNDGEWVAFGAAEPSETDPHARAYLARFSGGEPEPVGPLFRTLHAVGFPRDVVDSLRIAFNDEADSLRHAMLPFEGTRLRALPPGFCCRYIQADGRAVTVASTNGIYRIDVTDRNGEPERSIEWPDSLGEFSSTQISPQGEEVLLSGINWTARPVTFSLSRLDVPSGEIKLVSRGAATKGWIGWFQWTSTGELVFPVVPSDLGTEKTQLQYMTLSGAMKRTEELPLNFTDFRATKDMLRAVGIVANRRYDIYMIRSFDPGHGR